MKLKRISKRPISFMKKLVILFLSSLAHITQAVALLTPKTLATATSRNFIQLVAPFHNLNIETPHTKEGN